MTSSSGKPWSTAWVLDEVSYERCRQDAKCGQPSLPDGTGPEVALFGIHFEEYSHLFRDLCDYAHDHGRKTWAHVLLEEVFEALAESDPTRIREELIQVAAVAVQWVEDIDRRADN